MPNSTKNLPNKLDLSDKVAVVTGSSSGIGKAMALRLAAAGANVIVHACQNIEGGQQTVDLISQQGGKSKLLTANFINETERKKFVEECWNWQGNVHCWINNAGADVLTGDAKEWSYQQKLDYLWKVDVLSCIDMSKLIGNKMLQAELNNAAIVTIGWDQAEQGMEGDSGEIFATIKGAIMSFTRSLARTMAPVVRVNCVAPGWIKTSWGDTSSEYWNNRATNEALLKRWGTAEDVAEVAAFLVSPAASFMTGQIVPVNGGLDHSFNPVINKSE